MQNTAELVFIPFPGLSHLVPMVETAQLLLRRDHRISITLLIIKFPNDGIDEDRTHEVVSSYSDHPRLRFIDLPVSEATATSNRLLVFDFIDHHTHNVRSIVSDLINRPSRPNSRVAGLVVDMQCTKFVEVANELGLPSYAFFICGAAALGLAFHLVSLKYQNNQDVTRYWKSDEHLSVPAFSNPVPAKVLPAVFVQESATADAYLSYFKRIAETKGVLLNTFHELESYAVRSLQSDDRWPKVYPVGPGSSLKIKQSLEDGMKQWMDEQPEMSVVYLCFGRMGSFEDEQVKEIARALERSGKRFLWSLRKPAPKGTSVRTPLSYENLEDVLPIGFLGRTNKIGKVIGYAPQVEVLAHPAVGGFVSHCGWSSMLESVWFGVPIATFPLYADQQLIAFELVKELGMAVPIRIDYMKDLINGAPSEIVGAEEIEAAINGVMDVEGVRKKVKEMQEKSRMVLEEGGSSYNAQGSFIEDVMKNINLV